MIRRALLVLALWLLIFPAAYSQRPTPPRERLAAELAALPTPRPGDPAATATAILAEKEFRDAARPRQKSAIEKWLEDLWKRIESWFKRQDGRMPAMDFGRIQEIVRILLYGLGGIAAGFGLRYLLRWGRRLGVVRRARSDAAPDLMADEIVDPLAQARASASVGDTRNAVRYAYIAALRRLRDRGLLNLEKSRTNWEYQRSLPRSEAYDTLLPATRIFDAVWYGQRPAAPDEIEAVIAACYALDGVEGGLA